MLKLIFRPFILILLCSFSACTEKGKTLRITIGGDIQLDRGTRQVIEKKGIDFLFEDIRSILLNSDQTIANLECAVFNDSSLSPVPKKFNFRGNPEWIPSLKDNGITCLTLANNHSYDFGPNGVRQTLAHLKKYNIQAIGYKDSYAAPCSFALFEKGNIKIAVFNSTFLAQDNSIICCENYKELGTRIQAFKSEHPSHLVFVILHWGTELDQKPSSDQTEEAHFLIDQGASLIIGHHPHVVQTIEAYHGGYIFYSVGNFIFDTNRDPTNKGILTRFEVIENRFKKLQIIPFNIVNSKPFRMSVEESTAFLNEIKSISPGVEFKMDDRNWEITHD